MRILAYETVKQIVKCEMIPVVLRHHLIGETTVRITVEVTDATIAVTTVERIGATSAVMNAVTTGETKGESIRVTAGATTSIPGGARTPVISPHLVAMITAMAAATIIATSVMIFLMWRTELTGRALQLACRQESTRPQMNM